MRFLGLHIEVRNIICVVIFFGGRVTSINYRRFIILSKNKKQ